MPQPLGEWLTNKYGADLSAVTEISGVPDDVTGKFLFPRTLKSLYLPTIFELQTITNLNPPDTSTDTSTVPTRRKSRWSRQMHRSRDAQPAVLLRPQRSVPAPRGLEIANLKP